MAQEIERKFLVVNNQWRSGAVGKEYRQGYFPIEKPTIRVRVVDNNGILTIKSSEAGVSRNEYEYEIPLDDATELLQFFCEKPFIEKIRYVVEYAGKQWEIDEFHGKNEGLVLAEIELESAEEHIQLPPWVGKEVSHDPRYYNAYLYKYPYTEWTRS